LHVIDVSDPARPVLAGGAYGIASAQDIALSGNYAYVATGSDDGNTGSLQVIDVSNPAEPIQVGTHDIDDTPFATAFGVAVAGNYAYVAANRAGLVVIDISNPASPVRVARRTGGTPFDVAISGSYAYVADGDYLQVIDVTDPAAPKRIGGYNTSGVARGVAVFGNFAYVADDWKGLVVLRLSSLQVQITRSADQTIVSWPTAATGFSLETASSLDSGTTWLPVTSDVVAEGDRFKVIHGTMSGSAFYRLRHP
jgi:hypothetical protein